MNSLGQMNTSTWRYERSKVWTEVSSAIVPLARTEPSRHRRSGAFQNLWATHASHTLSLSRKW